MTNAEIQAYLNRLGIPEAGSPDKAFLFALHRAHVERVSWQTVDIIGGKPAGIDPEDSVRLISSGRSGYCFHLNGAFGQLLRSLGYQVHWHRAGVQPHGVEQKIDSFHLGITVSLPGGESGEERWIVDVGLGDMPYEPLPLQTGLYEQEPFVYRVMESSVAEAGWRLEHDPLGAFTGVDVAPEVVPDLEAFKPKHEFYSRSPESPWMKRFIVRHRHASGGSELRGCIWARRDGSGVVKTEISTCSRWLEVLADVFGEHLVNYSAMEREEMWKRVRSWHEEWQRSMDTQGKES